MVLFLWNVTPLVSVAGVYPIDGLATGLAATVGVLDYSDIIRLFIHDKSNSIPLLIKGKSRNLQQSFKYFLWNNFCV